MTKRLAALFLCLVMLFALAPHALAEGETAQPEAVSEESETVSEEPEAVPEEPETVSEEPEAISEEPEAVTDEPETVPQEPEALPELPAEAPVQPEEGTDAIAADPEEGIEAVTTILINEKNFPDETFRKWIIGNVAGVKVDGSGVCSITSDNAEKVLTINVDGQKIGSLVGVSKFPKLQSLSCNNNALEKLDVSGNKELTYLSCKSNKLEALTLGKTKVLETLICSGNGSGLKTVSLSYNTALKKFDAGANGLTKIDLSPCTELTYVDVANNQLEKLSITANTKLETLYCRGNKLTTIDLSKNTALTELRIGKNALTGLDVSKNTKLVTLECGECGLKTLKVTSNTALMSLTANSNALTALDVTKNTKLQTLNCNTNALKTLDVSKNTALLKLYLANNKLTSINVTANTKLKELRLIGNAIKTIDLSKNTALLKLYFGSAALTAIDLSKNTKLTYLDVGNNHLQELDLSNNKALVTLICKDNELTTLDLKLLTKLTKVQCENQRRLAPSGVMYIGGDYKFDMSIVAMALDKIQVKVYPYNKVTGYVTLTGYVSSFDYTYDTGRKDTLLPVTLLMPYEGTATIKYKDIQYYGKAKTPYVVYNGKAQKPEFELYNEDKQLIDPDLYTVTYQYNTNAGTAAIRAKFVNTSNTQEFYFKIYLPATTVTTAENVSDGIKISWKKVDGAAGYVIYRRAWSSTTNGWTKFERWNNTTDTTWTDTTVYAGTLYQYGIKAYFEKRLDPITSTYIGGNQNNNAGNYNLGLVGPLDKNVRITTRTIDEIRGYTAKLFVKWTGSSAFTGYEVQYALNSTFTQGVKTVKIKKASTTSTTISNLKSNTKYWIRIRSYHEFNGETYYGGWSSVKSASTN